MSPIKPERVGLYACKVYGLLTKPDCSCAEAPERVEYVRADHHRGAVEAERERIVKALREQAECYPSDSRFAHVGHGYLSAAEFVESLARVGGQ